MNIHFNHWLQSLGIFVGLMFISLSLMAKSKQPNIIYIMSDDHAAHAIGAYGGRLANLGMTPNLDQLAKEGLLFQNAFCTNSICTPSRASIVTGQYSQTTEVLDLGHESDTDKHYLPRSEQLKHYWKNTAGVNDETPHSWEFYDLKNDPQELHNRYEDPAYKEIIAELKVELKRQREGYNETDENYPEIQKIVEKHWDD